MDFLYFSEHPAPAGPRPIKAESKASLSSVFFTIDCSDFITITSTSHPDAPSERLVPVPPGALLEDPERIRLVEMIAKKLETVPLTLKISTFKTSYAALWLADIEKLKALADEKPLVIYSLLSVFETDVRLGQRCQQSSSVYHYVRLTVCYN